MKFGVSIGRIGQKGFPFVVVETRVGGPVCVEYLTLQVVVELNPKAIECDILK